jgi:hypothetical protein
MVYIVCVENWMPVQDVVKIFWFWLYTHVMEGFKSGLVKEYLRNYGLDY